MTFATVKEHIVAHVQKTFRDGYEVAESLRDEEAFDMDAERPIRETSVLPNATEIQRADKVIEQEGMDMVYQAELTLFLERKGIFRQNLTKAYALIYKDYCSPTIQHRVEESEIFDSAIRNDPIELLKAIRSLMHDPLRARFPFASLTSAMTRMVTIKQEESESLLDYVKRFKQNRDITKSHIGENILDGFVETLPDYRNETDITIQAALKTAAFETWMSYLLIVKSDKTKYGSLINGLQSQFSMGTDQYPRTILGATDILATHSFDQSFYEKKKKFKPQRNGSRSNSSSTPRQSTSPEASFAQGSNTIVCHCCGEPGHISPRCPKKDTIPREEWAVKRWEANHHQQSVSETDNASQASDAVSAVTERSAISTRSRSSRPEWSGLQVNLFGTGATMLRENIILDNGSTLSIFSNPELVEGIRYSKEPLEMSTNAGKKLITKEANVPGFGTVKFDEEAIANIMGFADLVDKHRITYDSEIEDAFNIHMPDGAIIAKFARSQEGLYVHQVPDDYKQNVKGFSNLVKTVTENAMGYTQRQYDEAVRARQLQHKVAAPTDAVFKALLRTNIIRNNPVTAEDVTIAERIFGPDVSSLQGKSTRSKQKRVKSDLIEIPKEIFERNRDLELCIDIMYINNVGMMTAIDRSIKFRTTVMVDSKAHEDYFEALDVVLRHYNNADLMIKTIQCDGEFRAMFESVKDELDVNMNYTNAGDHVPEAERNNRTIKERFRVEFNRLPYKALPLLLIKHLAMHVTRCLNYFPAKGGVSKYYSPRMILQQQSLDYNKHFQVPIGAYVQANYETDPTNTPRSRTRDAIYLRASGNTQGGHEVMDLNTGKLNHCRKVTEIPMTDLVIKAVEALAYKQGFTELKFRNRHGIIFHDADWTEGVDYAVENDANEDSDEDESDNDDDDDANDNDDAVPDLMQRTRDSDSDSEDDDDDDNYVDPDAMEQALSEATEVSDPIEHPVTVEDVVDDDESEDEDVTEPRQSTRARVPIERLSPTMRGQSYFQEETKEAKRVSFAEVEQRRTEYCHNLTTQDRPDPSECFEYNSEDAIILARYIDEFNQRTSMQGVEATFAQQYMVQKGLKKFGERGRAAAIKELSQMDKRTCFTPISVKDLTPIERKRAMEALMFLGEKRSGVVKGRMVYNGKPTREWLSKEDAASPTATLEGIMLTAVIDAHERRDMMCADVPNAFIQAEMPDLEEGDEKVIMKITGVLVHMLIQLNPGLYGPHVVYEKGRKVLYVQVLRAIYGMLEASLLWYKKFRKDLEEQGFKFNPYDPCIANRMIDGKQHTIRFHVDDVMSSHIDPKINDDFEAWLQANYGQHGPVVTHRGNKHDYLGMIFVFGDGKVVIDMIDYVNNMLAEFPMEFKETDVEKTPAGENLLKAGIGKKLDVKDAEVFHTTVARALYVCKRARLDIQPTIAILCSRVRGPNTADWNKLVRMMKYLNATRNLKHTMKASDLHTVKWHVDASFAVHPDFKSHTGGTMTFGEGSVLSHCRKQKLNTRSSTEAELVGADDVATMIFWTKHFLEEQGYDVTNNILYQDNKSTILLQENGRKSAGKRSRALNVRYFFLTDQIEKGNLVVKYCPTDDMTADFMTKPLQGEKFIKFRAEIMGLDL